MIIWLTVVLSAREVYIILCYWLCYNVDTYIYNPIFKKQPNGFTLFTFNSQFIQYHVTGVWESSHLQTWKTGVRRSKGSWCLLHYSMCRCVRENRHENYYIWNTTTRGTFEVKACRSHLLWSTSILWYLEYHHNLLE